MTGPNEAGREERQVNDDARDFLERSVKALRRMLEAIDEVTSRLEGGGAGEGAKSEAEVKAAIAGLSKIQVDVMRRLDEYEVEAKRRAGELDDSTIDFTKLRLALRQKLDLLARATRDDDVQRGPDKS